ncbi:Transcription initiation factor TFIID subunit 6 [Linum perenne]
MSIVPKETIEVIAQSIGVSNLSSDAALALAPDVEYRLREIIQESIKSMRHSRRTTLTTDDVDAALSLRNVEVVEAPLPKAPLGASVVCHWLAIEGVQPDIPENAPVRVVAPASDAKKSEPNDQLPVDIKLPVKHVLSRELQLYFDKITELTLRKSDSPLFKEALVSLATDSGLHPLVPYFTCFIADEVTRGLQDFSLLFALMRVVWSLLQNPHIHLEPYLHQLMPSVVTCLVARRLGNRVADNHWELRNYTANLVALICKRFGHVYNYLQTRLTKTLLNALLDPKKSLTQHYGAIQGLTALGPNVQVRLLLLPNLEPYLRLLEPEMLLEKQKNEMKRHEAWRVYGALLCAASQSAYERLRMFPPLPSPPSHTVWRTNHKVLTNQDKRKETTELSGQPPVKKIATDGSIDTSASGSSPSQMQIVAVGEPQIDSNTGPSSTQQANNGSESSHEIDRSSKRDCQVLKKSAILDLVWKDDLNSGQLLVSLFDMFGEGTLSFIPTPEMSLFL